jgi:Calcium-binding EGF domain
VLCYCFVLCVFAVFVRLLADIDECAETHAICNNGLCTNTPGSFRCVCNSGYELGRNGDDCIGSARTINYCNKHPVKIFELISINLCRRQVFLNLIYL